MGIKTDFELSLDLEALESFNEATAVELNALDADESGGLVFTEVAGAAIATPDGTSTVVIAAEQDWDVVYQSMAQSQINGQSYARFAASSTRTHTITAQAWLAEDASLIDVPVIKTATKPGNNRELPLTDLCDVKMISGDCYFLMHYRGKVADEDYYYTLRLPKEGSDSRLSCGVSVEFSGRVIDLRRAMASEKGQEWHFALDVASDLAAILSTPIAGVPDSLRTSHAEHLETMLFQGQYLDDLNKSTPVPEESATNGVKFRTAWSDWGLNSLYKTYSVAGLHFSYDIPIYAENPDDRPLTDQEGRGLIQAMQKVPAVLYDAVKKNDPRPLEFEILEDEVMTAFMQTPFVIGCYVPNSHKVFVRRSMVSSPALSWTIIHELSHAAYIPRDEPDDAVQYYYYTARTKAAAGKDSSAVCLYAYTNANDFFAESAVSYLNGEEDPLPIESRAHGEHSRAELRKKCPEMYLAMKLFFEADSPYCGDKSVFNLRSCGVLTALLEDEKTRPIVLAAEISVAAIVKMMPSPLTETVGF